MHEIYCCNRLSLQEPNILLMLPLKYTYSCDTAFLDFLRDKNPLLGDNQPLYMYLVDNNYLFREADL